MKKQVFFLILILLVLGVMQELFYNFGAENNIDAASVFDARAVGQVNVSLRVDTGPPLITINNPKNKTYENNISINAKIEFSDISGISWAAYNLDNGTNITIALDGNNEADFTFNATTNPGGFIFTVYANDTLNKLNSTFVYFNVNETVKFTVNYTTDDDDDDDDVTNFSSLNTTQIQNITNLTIGKKNKGKIIFKESINLSDDNRTDEPIQLDLDINISHNLIVVNASAFPNFLGKTATLYLYNLTFTNPRIIRNGGGVCPTSICQNIIYHSNNGTLIFDVTGFSNYSAEENPADNSGNSGGSSGGGGGGGASGYGNFEMEPTSLIINTEPGKTARETFKVKNTGNNRNKFYIDIGSLSDILSVDDSGFMIPFKSERIVTLTIKTDKEETVRGDIVVSTSTVKKQLAITIRSVKKTKEEKVEETLLERPEDITLPVSEAKYSVYIPLIIILLLILFLFFSGKKKLILRKFRKKR